MTPDLPDDYRRTLDEYVLRCALDPGIRELVVEGELDILFWRDVFERTGAKDVVVIDPDFLAIEDADVLQQGLVPGAKGRVLTVGAALVRQAATVVAQVGCVVDHDFDGVPAGLEQFVVETDGYSVENYGIGAASVQRFFERHLGDISRPGRGASSGSMVRGTPQDVIDRLIPPCVAITAIRKVLRTRHRGVGVIDGWHRRMKVTAQGEFECDAERLLKDCIIAGQTPFSEDDSEALKAQMREIACDPRRLVRGHDFTKLLQALLASRWGKRAAGGSIGSVEHESFERWVVLSIATRDFENERAPQTVQEWFAD